jgi:hypothetical protein
MLSTMQIMMTKHCGMQSTIALIHPCCCHEINNHWRTSIKSELKNLRDNRTWVVAEKLPETMPLASLFVFKLKLDADGAIERYNTRLVVCGD